MLGIPLKNNFKTKIWKNLGSNSAPPLDTTIKEEKEKVKKKKKKKKEAPHPKAETPPKNKDDEPRETQPDPLSLQVYDVENSHWIFSYVTVRTDPDVFHKPGTDQAWKNLLIVSGGYSIFCMQPTEMFRVFHLTRCLCCFRWIPVMEVVGKTGQVSCVHAMGIHIWCIQLLSSLWNHMFWQVYSFLGRSLFILFPPILPKEERD